MKKVVFTSFFVIIFSSLSAQILDDSTKLVYSLETVRLIKQRNLFLNDTTGIHPDSSSKKFYLLDKNQKSEWLSQDLGNMGTASRTVLFPERKTIWKEFGNRAFDLYKINADSVAYYHTFSPYTTLNYLQNNRGAVRIRFTQSQNISPRWNITFDVNRLASSKQISAGSVREARLIDGWNFVASSYYLSKNKKYSLLANFNHFNHKQIEQGGIQDLNDAFLVSEITQSQAFLTDAFSREFSNSWNLFHQYRISKGFDVFHEASYQRNKFTYLDAAFQTNVPNYGLIFDSTKTFSDTLSHVRRNYLLQSKQGIKGYYKGFLTNIYLKNQLFTIKNDSNNLENRFTDVILGGEINLELNKGKQSLRVLSELNFTNGGGLLLEGNLKIKALHATYRLVTAPQDYIFQRFENSLLSWNNDFKNQTIQQFYASYHLNVKNVQIQPIFQGKVISNLLYFNENALPRQDSATFTVFTAGGRVGYQFKKWEAENFFLLSNSQSDKFLMPRVINNTTIAYNFKLKEDFILKVGVKGYYRSSYYATAYQPLTQQFYLQNTRKVWGKYILDAFGTFNVKKVKVALQYNYLNLRGNKAGAFMETTPNYVAMRSSFHIAIDWPLFD